MPVSSTVYSILVNAPVPTMSLSANGLSLFFVRLSSSNMLSTKSGMLSLASTSYDFLMKFSLKVEYCFFAYCRDLIMLISLSHSINSAEAATPLCLRNLLALAVKSDMSLRLETPGMVPLNLVSNSSAVLTWSVACPSVNVARFSFKGFFSNPTGIS